MDQTQLIIGITGQMCSGKSTLSSIIMQRVQAKQIDLSQTFSTGNFLYLIITELKKLSLPPLLEMEEQQILHLQSIIQVAFDESYTNPMNNFKDIKEAMLDWKNMTVLQVCNQSQIKILRNLNYFHLIVIETPIMKRYQNFNRKYPLLKEYLSLELFCYIDDYISNIENFISSTIDQGKVVIENSGDEKDLLMNLINQQERVFRPIRPTWESYFMQIAHLVKQRSNCMKRAVGAVLIRNSRILSTGYNGTPLGKMNCYEGGCERCNSNVSQGLELEKCFCFHAEESGILELGTSNSNGVALYSTLFPCYQCSKIIIAAGITQVFYEEDYDNNARSSQLHRYMKVHKVSTQDYVF